MNLSSSEPNKKIFRNLLSRTRYQEPPQEPPQKPPLSSQQSASLCQDPFNVHPGDCLLSESDFTLKPSVLFSRNNARIHREIRRRRSRGSPELNDGRCKKTSNCVPVGTREKGETIVHRGWTPDPYHQYAYETRANATTTSALQKETIETRNTHQVNRRFDATTQTFTTTPSELISSQLNSSSIPSKYLTLTSFSDPLDRAIGTYNPDRPSAECGTAPPVGILNSPYGMNGFDEPPDPSHPSYDTDWDERLFDPVPGAGVYAGELIDPSRTPKDWNVVYVSLDWASGEVIVRALPYNRRGMKTGLVSAGTEGVDVKMEEIELRRGFGDRLVGNINEEAPLREIEDLCKERLIRKAELDYKRELRFEEDIRRFWREKRVDRIGQIDLE